MPPKKGKKALETEPTAAAARSRRSTTAVQDKAAATAKPKAAPKAAVKAAPKVATDAAPKKRGRPAKDNKEPKEPTEPAEPPKKRGRPSKGGATEDVASAEPMNEAKKATKKGQTSAAAAIPDHARSRGESPEGGETLKIAGDEEAAAEQLEEELLDTAEAMAEEKKEVKGKASSKRKAPSATSEKAKKSKNAAPASNAPTSDRQFWLMKAEQEDRFEKAHDGTEINTKFTIDDLRSKTLPEPWDGVRNAVAAKNMRAMRKGDLAFFYASGGKQGRSPGIVGIMEIVSEAEPDVTVSDPSAYGFVEKEGDRGRWCAVGVEFRKKLSRPVPLKQLQEHKGPGGRLEGMQLFRQTRLSVAKVEVEEWEFICRELIEGYEE